MLNAFVSTIDKRLRAGEGIFEYSNCPRCIFRVHIATCADHVALADGTSIAAGSRLIHLHIWNEHVPVFPAQGPTLGWARGLCSDFELSLRELARFVASRPALEDVAAIYANMAFGSPQQTQYVGHLAARFGFVRPAGPLPRRSLLERLHLIGENILIAMLVASRNPSALRADCFHRDRVPAYIRRAEFIRRFGNGLSEPAGRISPAARQ